jgi:hypothetical protein
MWRADRSQCDLNRKSKNRKRPPPVRNAKWILGRRVCSTVDEIRPSGPDLRIESVATPRKMKAPVIRPHKLPIARQLRKGPLTLSR